MAKVVQDSPGLCGQAQGHSTEAAIARRMWAVLIDHFRRYPAQEKVVRLMIQNGLRIERGKVMAGTVAVSDTAMARAAMVDRRIVRATVQTIAADAQLSRVFGRFAPTLHLKDVAPAMGAGVVQVVADDANQPGILAGVSQVIAQAGLSVRQAIVEDPDFTDEPVLFVVTGTPIPGALVPELQRVRGVKSVTLRSLET
jgi:predicted regulator of amino acid metabolism with ACT domain